MTTKTMTTETITATAGPATLGPKIKTALPGPNAKRVLANDEKYISPSYNAFVSAGGQERPRHRDYGCRWQ